jgi:hypothetical protein
MEKHVPRQVVKNSKEFDKNILDGNSACILKIIFFDVLLSG